MIPKKLNMYRLRGAATETRRRYSMLKTITLKISKPRSHHCADSESVGSVSIEKEISERTMRV
jgi:hypothetical protein